MKVDEWRKGEMEEWKRGRKEERKNNKKAEKWLQYLEELKIG